MSVPLQTAWLQGYIAGLRAYAWWENGVEMVGTCGTTLKRAIEDAKRDYKVIDDAGARDAKASTTGDDQ